MAKYLKKIPRYIDADKLKEQIADMRDGYPRYREDDMVSVKTMARIIDEAPTIEPEKPNGGWIHDGADYENGKVTAIYVSHELHGLDRAKFVPDRPHGEWEYLKEHITEMRDADGNLNQKETCQFILNLMKVIEEEGGGND